jgi:hypothetical protein
MLQWPSRGNFCVQEDGNWKKRWYFAEGSKLASKQKCVQDNSGIFADERDIKTTNENSVKWPSPENLCSPMILEAIVPFWVKKMKF